jgi:hypothetical protein
VIGEVVQVLAGVVEVDDLGGLGEACGGQGPDPFRAVADDGELADVPRAAADGLGGDERAELLGGLEAGQVAGGTFVLDRAAVRVTAALGEQAGELDLAGVRAAVGSLPGRPAVSAGVMGTPVPSTSM